jgi:hypothetical protein
MRFLHKTRGGLFERVAEVVVRDCRQDHAQGIGLVVESCGTRREYALAGCASPELDDLKLLFACASAGEVVAAAVGAGIGLLGGEWYSGDPGDGGHTINSMCSPYHALHGNRKTRTRRLEAVGITDFVGARVGWMRG